MQAVAETHSWLAGFLMDESDDNDAWKTAFTATYENSSRRNRERSRLQRECRRAPSPEALAARAARLAAAQASVEAGFAAARDSPGFTAT